MFHQPDLVEGIFITGVGKFMHRLRDGFVRLQAKLPDKNFIVLQNNISAGKRIQVGEYITAVQKGMRRPGTAAGSGKRLQHHPNDIDIA